MRKNLLFLVFIIVLASYFRFNNLDWDSGFHLHPDERFLTMVGGAMNLPRNVGEYLDPAVSPFNPAIVGFRFFAYGVFPIILNKFVAFLLQNNTYDAFMYQGRFLSALADLFVVIFVYKTVKVLLKNAYSTEAVERAALWSSFLYAISTLPIQLSHFFTVDTFLNFFMFAAFYFSLISAPIAAVFFGLAIGSKITALFIAPLIFFVLFMRSKSDWRSFVRRSILFVGIVYCVIRIVNPYYFESSNIFDPRISGLFLQNIRVLRSLEGNGVWYPPAVQWIGKPPIIFSLINLAIFGVGVPYFVLVVLGVFGILRKRKKKSDGRHVLYAVIFWTVAFFVYQSMQFVKNMRYFIFLYPFLGVLGGLGGLGVFGKLGRWGKIIAILLLLIPPVMFSTIYGKKHSRVAASEWIYRNLPSQSLILGEYWDDPLPLPVAKRYGKQFRIELLPVFDPDTEEKWKNMNTLLEKADYYILSSNRGWGSVPNVPEKYPRMSKFYKDLLAGKTNYQKMKEFTSYPTLYLGIMKWEMNDDGADESFIVYDHPKVMIFQRKRR